MKIYTLWTANRWLMRDTFELHGVFSSLNEAIRYTKKKDLVKLYEAVVIECGKVDNYKSTAKRVLSSTFDEDRKKLI